MTSLSTRPLLLVAVLTLAAPALGRSQTLEGFASFPADTFAPGPTSGQCIAATNGRTPPFVDEQPVQGISSVLRAWNGDDFRVSPEVRTKHDSDGTIDIKSFISIRDPHNLGGLGRLDRPLLHAFKDEHGHPHSH